MARRRLSILAALVALSLAGPARAETVEELDARLEAELGAIEPAAVATFHEANEARLAGDHARARELFGEVMKLAPTFTAATRRACQAEFELKHREEALALCRRAVEREGSSLDDVTLAIVLVTPPTSETEIAEARALSRRAMERAPSDAYVVASACEVAEDAHDVELIRAAADTFAAATRDPRELVCKTIAAATRGQFEEAEDLAQRAEDAGAPADVVAHLGEAIRASRPTDARVLVAVVRVAATLAAALVLVVFVALAVGALVASKARRDRPISRALGLVSRVALWLLAAAELAAIPALVAVSLVVVGVSMQRWLTPGGVPATLVAASAVAVAATFGARKLLWRSDDPPGAKLPRDAHPRLYEIVDAAAERVGTPRIHAVYLTPDVEVAAFDRAGLVERLLGPGERAVVIGAGGLAGLSSTELGTLVAVEVAPLALGGSGAAFARAVRRAFGDAPVLRKSWWFFRLVAAVFIRASAGAIAADTKATSRRVAAALDPIDRDRASKKLAELGERHRALVDEALDEADGCENLYRSSPRDQVEHDDAWALLSGREALERAMTARLFDR